MYQSAAIVIYRAMSTEQRQTWNKTTECARRKATGLLKDQRSICQRNLELMPFVVAAARQTVDVCEDLFADRRWNCSTIHTAPNYLPDLTGGWLVTDHTIIERRYWSPHMYFIYIYMYIDRK